MVASALAIRPLVPYSFEGEDSPTCPFLPLTLPSPRVRKSYNGFSRNHSTMPRNSMSKSRKNRRGANRAPRNYGDSTALVRQPNIRPIRVSQLVGVGPIGKVPADSGNSYTFRLTDVGQYTQFTALFDMYRIDAVEVEFLLSQMGGNMQYPALYWTPDYDDSSVPANAQAVLDYQQAEIYQFTEAKTSFRRLIKPKLAQTVYNGVIASGYAMAPPGIWVNTDQPGVSYYGMKYWLVGYNSTTANQSNVQITLRYHLSFKTVR